MIYQIDNGGDNSGKKPSGGVIGLRTAANSMSVVVANPITFYGNWGPVINQSGQSGDLYNYYWTSYSRGTDGKSGAGQVNASNWHNLYLDSYIPLRHKSIYDPCPYGYRIPSNGTYNQFTSNPGWTLYSYAGGIVFGNSWFIASGNGFVAFDSVSVRVVLCSSTVSSNEHAYNIMFIRNQEILCNLNNWAIIYTNSVRCIEECEMKIGGVSRKQLSRNNLVCCQTQYFTKITL